MATAPISWSMPACRRGAEKLRPRARAQSEFGARLDQPRRLAAGTRPATRRRWRATTRRSPARRISPKPTSIAPTCSRTSAIWSSARGAAASPRFDEAAAAYEHGASSSNRACTRPISAAAAQSDARRLAGGLCRLRPSLGGRRPGYRRAAQPRWDGAPRAGERLVLVAEQGLGDTIQFCRFAPLLAARGFDVTILVRKAMAPLLSTLKGVTIATDAAELAQDKRPLRWLPLLSVPGVLGITPENVPARRALSCGRAGAGRSLARPARQRRLQDRHQLGVRATRTRPHITRRDIALAEFRRPAALPGVELVSLQKGAAADADRQGRVSATRS